MKTKERLITLLTPKSCDIDHNRRRISMIEYNARKRVLMSKMNKIFDIIQTNYWSVLEECISAMGPKATPIKFMVQIHKMNVEDVSAERKNTLLVDYVIELFIVMNLLKQIEDYVENTIEYVEPIY